MTTQTTFAPETDLFNENLERPLYKLPQVRVAAFFGGPLAAAFMIARNFKNMDRPEMARKTWIYGIIAAIIYAVVELNMPQKIRFVNYGFLFAFVYGAKAVVDKWQGNSIHEHLSQGGKTQSGWNCFGVIMLSLLCMVLLIAPYIIYVLYTEMHNA